MKRAIYVDYENVNIHGLEAIEKLGSDDYVKIFIGTQTTRLSMEDANRIFNCEAHVELITNKFIGKNALDFIIMVYMGYDIAKELAGAYFVVSNDKGYDPAIYQMRKLSGCTVLRKSDISFVLREKLAGGSVTMDSVAPLDVIIEKEPLEPVKSVKESEKKAGVGRRLLGFFGIGKKVQEEIQPEPAEITEEEIETERIVVNKNLQDESLKEKIFSEYVADNSGSRRGNRRGGRTNSTAIRRENRRNDASNFGNTTVSRLGAEHAGAKEAGNKKTGNAAVKKTSAEGHEKNAAKNLDAEVRKKTTLKKPGAESRENAAIKKSDSEESENVKRTLSDAGKTRKGNTKVKNLVNIDLKPADETKTGIPKSGAGAESGKTVTGVTEKLVKAQAGEVSKNDNEKQETAVKTERSRNFRNRKNRQEKAVRTEKAEDEKSAHPVNEIVETVSKQAEKNAESQKSGKPAVVVKFNNALAPETKENVPAAEDKNAGNQVINAVVETAKKTESDIKGSFENETQKGMNISPQRKNANTDLAAKESASIGQATNEKATSEEPSVSETEKSAAESSASDNHRKSNHRNRNRRKSGGKSTVSSENKDGTSFPVSPQVLNAGPESAALPASSVEKPSVLPVIQKVNDIFDTKSSIVQNKKEMLTEIKPDEIEFPDEHKGGRRRNNRRRGRGGQNAGTVTDEKSPKSTEEIQREKDRAEAFALLAALDEEENKRKPTVYRPNRRKNNS